MGARQDVPPWRRGETYANLDPTILDAANITLYGYPGVNLEGRTYVFEADADATALTYSAIGADPTGRQVTVKVLRNNSGVALKPGRVVHYDAAATDGLETGTDGYCYAANAGDRPAGVVDDYLPAAGVAANDLFYVVIKGPTRVVNGTTGVAIVPGARLVPGAGTSRTNNDSGRVALQSLAGATTVLGSNIQNTVGFGDATNSTSDTPGTTLIAAVVHLGSG